MASDSLPATGPVLKKGDWIRYQLLQSRMVLEGFIQEMTPDKLKVGQGPQTPGGEWRDRASLRILHHQPRY
jgi:hypothetical protein